MLFFFRSFHKNAMTNLTPGSTCLFNVFQCAERVSCACLPFTWRPWSQKGIFRARTSQLSRLQQRLGYFGAKMSGCHDASNFLRAGVTQFSEFHHSLCGSWVRKAFYHVDLFLNDPPVYTLLPFTHLSFL